MGNKYEKPFLKSVIFRIDLAQPFRQSEELAADFHKIIKEKFQNKEEIIGTHFEATLGTGEKDKNIVRQRAVTNYKFSDADGNHILLLEFEPPNLNLLFNAYKNSDELKEFVDLISTAANKVYGDIIIKRVGLRYINNIVLSGDAFQWAPFIDSHLISILDFPPEKRSISRGLGRIELVKDSYSVLFQFGMFNPEFPNPIARKEFILDYDCYTNEERSIADVSKTVMALHEEVKRLFESSILDELRVIMGVVKDE